MGLHINASMHSRKSGYLRFALFYVVPALTVLFFLLHSRLIVLLEQDLQRHQHQQNIKGIDQLYGSQQQQQQQQQHHSSKVMVVDGNNLGICHKLLQHGNEHATTSSIWLNSKQKLLFAIMGETEYHQEGSSSLSSTTLIPAWLNELWKFLTPWNLQQTTFPQANPIILQQILNKLQVRLSYLQQQQQQQQGHTNTSDGTTSREPPKIQVLVFGGSVAEGVGCDAPPPLYMLDDDENKEDKKSQWKVSSLQECSWPQRLQQLADAVFPNAIEIHNLAVGGTHSRAAVPILEHGLYPPHVHVNENHHHHDASSTFSEKKKHHYHHHYDPPDIILNAYAANDNLPPAFYNTQNTTLDNFHKYRVLKRLLEFVDAATVTGGKGCDESSSSKSHHHHPTTTTTPWIVFLNDYMGNQQESLVGESTVDELVQLLMQTLSAVSYVSPSRLLEPYIWANTTEHVWSGVWKKKQRRKKNQDAASINNNNNNNNNNKDDDYKVDVHYGMAGHITTAMVAAHAFFQWTMEYCQEQVLFGDTTEADCSSTSMTSSPSLPPLQETRMTAHELASALQIELPSKEWMKANHPDRVYPNITEGGGDVNNIMADASSSTTLDCGGQQQQQQRRCAFAFLAAPLGTHSKKGPLQEYINGFTTTIHNNSHDGGWQVQNNFRHGGFQNKLGLAATRTGAQLELKVPIVLLGGSTTAKTTRHIMKLTIHYLKSYGPDWANSRLRGTVKVQQQQQVQKGSQEKVLVPIQQEQQQTFELEGFHDQQVSISYTHVMPIAIPVNHPGENGETALDIHLKLELIGGSNFKINAMMLC